MAKAAENMSSHERALRAIEHKETDRLPRDFQAESPIIEALCRRLGLDDETALRQHFRVDMTHVWVEFNCPYEDGRDMLGVKYATSSDGATYSPLTHPLADAKSVEDVKAHQWPNPDWLKLEALKEKLLAARRRKELVICSTWASIFTAARQLMGMDNCMVAFHTAPEVLKAIIRKLTDFHLEVDRRIFTTYSGLIDMAFYGTDFGTQRALMIRRQMFQEFFAGPLRELVNQVKSFGLKAMMHSCGAVSEIIPDFIDIGFDVLDPVQFTAEGMSPKVLKQKFGDRIAFHGCISAQKVLPRGTPEEVRNHVREVCEIMKPGGGYIFTSDQAVTKDTPVDNVLAMYDAIDEFGY